MEGFTKYPASEDQSVGTGNEQNIEKHPAAHVEIFDRPEGTYEDTSFLYEPMEAYKDDLFQIGLALETKRIKLKELEQIVAAHVAASEGSALHLLEADLAKRITALKEEIGRWEIVHTVTQQRLMILARRDQFEQKMINRTPTDIEQ